jgi:sodium transport system permease protein
MNLKLVRTIYRKEMLDTLRDRRTLISMILIPLVIFPILIFGMSSLMKERVESTRKSMQKVALIGEEYAPKFVSLLESKRIFELVKEKDYLYALKEKKIAMAVEFSQDFEKRIAQEDSAQITVYLDEAEFKTEITLEKLNELIDTYRDSVVTSRLKTHQLEKKLLKPLGVTHKNVASKEKMGGFILSMFLPYMIIILCITGAMYPAIDLTAGEKERGTMETILSSPASHLEITAGKFLTVLTASVITAVLSTTSMVATLGLGFSQMGQMPQEVQISIQPFSIVLLLIMILPVACLFSSLLLSLALFAKSYKEAQSYISPLMIVVILPAMASFVPGFELNRITALIPVVNVSLGAKDILVGNFQWGYIGFIFLSTVVYASLSLFVTKRLFDKEEVLFRI